MIKPTLYIDADGCPVVSIAIDIALEFGIDVVIVCDYAHVFHASEHVDVCLCDQGKDSVDFEIIRRVKKGDFIITQDYGLASLLLSKDAYVLSQNGLRYTQDNIEPLLAQRHYHGQLRKSGKRTPHMKKRTKQEDQAFVEALIALCEEVCYG